AVAHDQRAEVRVTKPERAENMRVLRDVSDRIACVVDNDLLCSDENAHRRLESLNIKIAVGGLELHQVEIREIAGGVVQEEVLRAWIRGILPVCTLACVPLVDRGIELHSRITADVCALGDLA